VNINLEQAKRLWELGVRKLPEDMYSRQAGSDKFTLGLDGSFCVIVEQFPAYNAEELIKLLRSKEHISIEIYSHGDGFLFHQEGSFVAGEDDIYGNTLTEALCNKLIYDIENGIITPEEINK